MLRLGFDRAAGTPFRVLCLGAHSDDIEIGCGGTILKLLQTHEDVVVHWVAFSSGGIRAEEARRSAEAFLARAGRKNIIVHDLRASFFPYIATEIKDLFEGLKKEFSPDLIFTHYGKDLHQDHRTISELTWNSFRDHLILEYEIPKYDGDLGSPNVFVHLDQATTDQKIAYILEHFQSQADKHWFDKETFSALMRIRGVESCSRYAEAFYSRKIVFG